MPTPLDLLSRRVAPSAPAAPSFTIAEAIRSASVKFCERTRCWRYEVSVDVEDDPVPVPPGTPWDALPISLGVMPSEPAIATASIHEIERAWFGPEAYPLTPKLLAELSPQDRAAEGPPAFISHVFGNEVIIAPREPGTLRLSLFLKPSTLNPIVSQHVVPAFVADRYSEAIVHGALGRLLAVPNTSWSNPELAAFHAASFEEACAANFNAHTRGLQRAPRRARMNFRF